jgi:formylmethanofuran dehydrogenase subunit C
MSDAITLTLRAPPAETLEVECISPARFATMAEREIAGLPLRDGRGALALGEVFTVHGDRASRVRVEGDLRLVDAIGAGMDGGELVIEGPVGRYVGTRMSAGTLVVHGDAGYGAGLEMTGGTIEITGSAGDRLGAARLGASRGMTGGEIIVRGSVGAEAGASARRGTVVVGGNAGERAGFRMIAGNVVVLGDAGRGAGEWSKRGSIVVLGSVEPPITYRYACTYRPPHIAVTLRRLRQRYSLPLDEQFIYGLYRRYSGDMAELAKGEILHWTGER